jgi:hypothetical protein
MNKGDKIIFSIYILIALGMFIYGAESRYSLKKNKQLTEAYKYRLPFYSEGSIAGYYYYIEKKRYIGSVNMNSKLKKNSIVIEDTIMIYYNKKRPDISIPIEDINNWLVWP